MGKINWNRTKNYRSSETKYEDGMKLDNGTIVHKSLDHLALRARAAEREWLRQNRMSSIHDQPPKQGRKKQKYKGMTFFNQPATFDDVALNVLDQMKGRK